MKRTSEKRRSAKASTATRKSRLKRTKDRTRSAAVEARYDDATWSFGERSWLPASVQDARLDADSSTRLELVRRSRYWSRNSSISIDCGDIFAQYVVGPNGLQLIPSYAAASGEIDESADAWDEAASRWWSAWSKFPAVDSQLPLQSVQNVMAHSWWHDGEVFIYKTYSPETGRPRIQLIEGHRIATPPEKRSEEGKSIIDGVEFRQDMDGRPTGRPIRYWLRTDIGANQLYGGWSPQLWSGGSYRPIPATQMIYLGDPDRPGMVRSLPKATGRMNDLHDLQDLQLMENKAARDAAEITNVVTNKPGEANTAMSRRQRFQIQGQDAAGNPVIKPTPLFYEVTMGGRTVYIATGEKFEQFKSERPSVAVRDHWDYLVRKIAGPMWILMLPQPSLQGTQVRGFFDVANTFFRTHTGVMAAVWREIYVWVMGWAVQFDRALDGAPDEWWHVDVIPPRSVIVDVGRNSQAVLNELKAGLRTYKGECGELGRDYRAVLRQKAIEANFINRLVDQYNVTGRQIAELAAESLRVTEKVTETAAEVEEENPDAGGGEKPATSMSAAAAIPPQPIIVNIENKQSSPTVKKIMTPIRGDDGRAVKYEIEEIP